MKRVTLFAIGCFIAILAAMTLNVAAQDFNPQERTYLTFSNAVELPGMTLQPGTYTFRLADSPSRNVVQVLSQDEKEVFGQFLFVQKERPDVTADTVVTFRETPAGTTPAIQYWFYPNEKIGKEFIYPKDQALRIAKVTRQAVLTEEGPVTAEAQVSAAAQEPATPAAAPAPTTGNRTETTVAETPAYTPPPPQPPSTVSERPVGTSGSQAAPPAPSPAPAPSTTRSELPKTASSVPLIGLLGVFSLLAGIGVRFART